MLAQTYRLPYRLIFLGLVGLLLLGCGSAPEVELPASSQPMQLQSSAFDPEETIPQTYTCDGQDLSPPLSWDAPPEGTQSLALIADDPDAPSGTFVHWIIFNLAADVRSLPEAVPPDNTLPSGGIQGKNGFGNIGFGGPCPPSGTHRYFFKLYALDTELDLGSGASKPDVVKAIDGHILGHAELMGTYSR
ncbi:MAG: YbhB/YbcL family Raf kinase inhibitor-like protein [Elainellaceae cyanobacterium]